MNLLPRAYNYLHLKNACPTDGRRVAQSFRAASIGTAKAVHYRFNKDVLHDKNENYFMPPVLSNPKNPINTINTTKGYTLIELAVVVVLIGLMLAISIPRFQYAVLTDGLKTTTRRIIGLVKGLRNEAIREQKVYLLHFDIGSNRIWSESDAITEEERELARERYFQVPPDVHILDVWCSGKGKKVDGGCFWVTVSKPVARQ